MRLRHWDPEAPALCHKATAADWPWQLSKLCASAGSRVGLRMAHLPSLLSSAHTLVRSSPCCDSVCLQQLLSSLAAAGLFFGVAALLNSSSSKPHRVCQSKLNPAACSSQSSAASAVSSVTSVGSADIQYDRLVSLQGLSRAISKLWSHWRALRSRPKLKVLLIQKE